MLKTVCYSELKFKSWQKRYCIYISDQSSIFYKRFQCSCEGVFAASCCNGLAGFHTPRWTSDGQSIRFFDNL